MIKKAFKIHDIDSAPEKSKHLLEDSLRASGRIPGLHGVLAESPNTLDAYQTLGKLFVRSSFSKEELTVVWQTINVEHGCHYCVPAHTGIALGMNVDPQLDEALRNRAKMPNQRLQALHEMTLAIVRSRARVSPEQLEAFYAAGYENQHVLEIILGLSQKIISNYTIQFANTPVDKVFEKYTWKNHDEN